MSGRNVVAARYSERGAAYDAFSRIKQAERDGLLTVHHLVALDRGADGGLTVSDGSGTDGAGNAVVGGVIGTLVGVLGEPLGMLLGLTTVPAVGTSEAGVGTDASPSALRRLARIVAPGGAAVVADVTEPSTEIVDRAIAPSNPPQGNPPQGNPSQLDPVLRCSTAGIQAEVDAIGAAQAEAQRAADRVLRAQHRPDRRDPDQVRD